MVNIFYRCDRCNGIIREADTFIINENSNVEDVAYDSEIFCLKCFEKELLKNKEEITR